MKDLVTIAVTTFDRPAALRRLVASIRVYYPDVTIIIGSNGREHPEPMPGVEFMQLHFDIGVSATRNALMRRVGTPFVYLTEDDCVFIKETRLEVLAEVLDRVPEIGLVGHSLIYKNRPIDYATDLSIRGNTLYITKAKGPELIVRDGVTVQIVDQTFNTFLARTPLCRQLHWDEDLKLGEHYHWFWTIKKSCQWKVACCPVVCSLHDHVSSDHYEKYRRSARDFLPLAREKIGVSQARSLQFFSYGEIAGDVPNIVVFGVGHSGTSIFAGMLYSIGWNPNDADEKYGEQVSVRKLNDDTLRTEVFDIVRAENLVANLNPPWAIKDPRLVATLDHWVGVFARFDRKPILAWIRRDIAQVKESYLRREELSRGVPRSRGRSIDQLFQLAEDGYDKWPWNKFVVRYEDIAGAVALWDWRRFNGSGP